MTTLRMLLIMCFAGLAFSVRAQEEWPKVINTNDGSVIKVYEPQPESFKGNILKSRAAVSLLQNGQKEPVFGTFWSVATVDTDRDNRRLSVQSVHIPNLKFPGDIDNNTISYVKTTLEAQLPAVESDLPLDEILASLDMNTEQKKQAQNFNNAPPKIYYASNPSLLVSIDGAPKFKHNKDWDLDVVVNTPFTIVKNDGSYYLYGGKKWYKAPDPLGPYNYTESIPSNLQKVASAVDNQNNADPGYSDSTAAAQSRTVSDIIVSTQPAELIQTHGDPEFVDIQGTSLQYARNSENDIFFDTDAQQYYVLISGRWYKSPQMGGPWDYVPSNSLPADFAKIPEGSPKDNVLASIPGTSAAREAVMDAQIPQTAKVDRRTASTNVTYDGAPRFQSIPGTHLQYAVNTQSSVLAYKNQYYTVDKGVWFVSNTPTGPWAVATDRPDEVDAIPPSSPAYNLKYVYIYDVTPDYVYMGYTPGYLNNYVCEATVVYGTGYNYAPWWGDFYYPRPFTWGFGVSYNPWWGWNLGFGYSYGWFHLGFGFNTWPGWCGGWWGPPIYRPPFRYWGGWGGYYGHGYYGRGYYGPRYGNVFMNRNTTIINNRTYINNIYHYRNDVVTNNNGRFTGNNIRVTNGQRVMGAGNNGGMRPGPANSGGMRPGPSNGYNPGGRTLGSANPSNRVFTDHDGNVYQRGNQGQWQQRQQRQWQPVDNNRRDVIQNLNRQQQMQNRGEMRSQSFQQFRSGGSMRPSGGGGFSRPSFGGGGRSFGGGGGRRR